MKREASFEEKRWVRRAMVPMGLWAVASTILVFMAWIAWPEWFIISTALWIGSALVASSVLAMWQAYRFPEGGEPCLVLDRPVQTREQLNSTRYRKVLS